MRHQWIVYGLAAIGGSTVLYVLGTTLWPLLFSDSNNQRASTTVEVGLVESALQFSGQTRSDTTAQLTFATPGTVSELLVREGDIVIEGQVLARLDSRTLLEDRREAQAALAEAIAAQRDLLQGASIETVALAETSVKNAQTQLVRVEQEQAQLVENVRRTFLSQDLVAFPVDPEERTTAPTISGTYRCSEEGRYEFHVFRSAADSGFSVRVSGLETDTVPVSFTQAVPFGTCGLRAQFVESVLYSNTRWTINVPNEASPSYIQNRNQLETAELNATNAISAAQDALTIAEQQRSRDIAPTREEQINQATARIAGLEARIAGLETRIDERTLRAPFSGTITAVDTVVGETISSRPIITLLGEVEQFEMRVRVPEVDITNLSLEQSARITFDTRPNEPVAGLISRISPLPTEIDGVAYFTATIIFTEQPAWLRTGLNAEVEIITDSRTTLRVPTGFLTFTDEATTVSVRTPAGAEQQPVTIDLIGSNGFTALSNIATGTTVLAP